MNSKTRKTSVRASQETILLVDDDPSLREMVGRVLAEEGYCPVRSEWRRSVGHRDRESD